MKKKENKNKDRDAIKKALKRVFRQWPHCTGRKKRLQWLEHFVWCSVVVRFSSANAGKRFINVPHVSFSSLTFHQKTEKTTEYICKYNLMNIPVVFQLYVMPGYEPCVS